MRAAGRRRTPRPKAPGVDAAPLRQARGWGYQRRRRRRQRARRSTPRRRRRRARSRAAAPRRSPSRCQRRAAPAGRQLRRRRRRARRAAGRRWSTRCAPPPPIRRWRSATATRPRSTTTARSARASSEVELVRDETGRQPRSRPAMTAMCRRYGLLHERQLNAHQRRPRAARRGPADRQRAPAARPSRSPFAIRFHLAPGDRGHRRPPTARARCCGSRARSGSSAAAAAGSSIEDSLWIDGEARPHATLQLVVTGETPGRGHRHIAGSSSGLPERSDAKE